MLSTMEGYVPHTSRLWGDFEVALGSTAPDTLPEDVFDAQPLWSRDRSAVLVATVRLDNRSELERDLAIRQPERVADADVLLAAWERWGAACVDRLLGAYAFTVWTPSRREVFAARDHVGERPLFYAHNDAMLGLASMPKGLLELFRRDQRAAGRTGIDPRWGEPRDEQGAVELGPGPVGEDTFNEDTLMGWISGVPVQRGGSFFRGIDRLPAGHFLRHTPGRLEIRQYWHPKHATAVRYSRDEEYAEAMTEILDRAVAARLRSVRPVGSFLSGGFDSGAVTASAALQLGARGERLPAFTAVPLPEFDGQVRPGLFADETAAAAELARMYPNIDHATVDSRGYELLPNMKRWTDALDEPALNPVNMLWMSAILDRARQSGLGAMLAGEAGNATISWATFAALTEDFNRLRWGRLLGSMRRLRAQDAAGTRTMLRAASRGVVPLWLNRLLAPKNRLDGLLELLLLPEAMRRHDLRNRLFAALYARMRSPLDDQTRLFEIYDFGPFRTAAHAISGVEVRDPTADKRLFEFSFAVPREQFLAGGRTRSLVRRAMRGRLPQATLERNDRGTQGADWYLPVTRAREGLRAEARAMRHSATASRLFDLVAIEDLLDRWPQKDFHQPAISSLWHYGLTRAISAGYFLRSHEARAAQTDETAGGTRG